LSVKLINHAGPNRDNALNLSRSKQFKIAFDLVALPDFSFLSSICAEHLRVPVRKEVPVA